MKIIGNLQSFTLERSLLYKWFNARAILLLLLAACFIASVLTIFDCINIIRFFVAFFCFGILNRRPLLIFLGLAFLSPRHVHDLLNRFFAQWNLLAYLSIGLALELFYGRSPKKGPIKDYKVNKNTKRDLIFR